MNITFYKDRGGLHILDNDTGIGLHVWDVSGDVLKRLENDPDANGCSLIERQLREALKVIVKHDPTMEIKLTSKDFIYTPERSETVWQ